MCCLDRSWLMLTILYKHCILNIIHITRFLYLDPKSWILTLILVYLISLYLLLPSIELVIVIFMLHTFSVCTPFQIKTKFAVINQSHLPYYRFKACLTNEFAWFSLTKVMQKYCWNESFRQWLGNWSLGQI